MLPNHLVLVRHGKSEGNVAVNRSKKGDHSDYTPEFVNRHSAHFRLLEKGCEQARVAGEWLRSQGLASFQRHYVSEYTRALETAALLGLEGAKWYVDFQLRERDYGLMDVASRKTAEKHHAEYLRQREVHSFYAPLPSGESMAQACDRLRGNIVDTLHRELADQSVIVVCHGEVIQCFRVIFERMMADEYHQYDKEDPKWFRIGNGQVVHYTRVNPEAPEDIRNSFGWVRSVNPSNPDYAGHDWRPISRRTYSNEELLEMVEARPALVKE